MASETFPMFPRSQVVGIGRLPARRQSGDNKQVMNCKSCRKRKIKCNRLLPSCEACQVFNCPCIYDAVPKKRGPKTDVIEALVKRVNGLEKRLKDEGKAEAEASGEADGDEMLPESDEHEDAEERSVPKPTMAQTLPSQSPVIEEALHQRVSVVAPKPQLPQYLTRETIAFTDALLDTYFARLHNKPYYILDEANTRQRLRDGQLPQFTINAIHAVSIRFVPHLCGGHAGAVRSSQDYAAQARAGIDVDEPSIDALQALLLLTIASFQAGRGRKSFMLLSHAVSMAFALDLHREVSKQLRVASIERQGRRRLFWTCYLMDRFSASGSKRPALISDDAISLRYPAGQGLGPPHMAEGNFFPNGSNLPHTAGSPSELRGGAAILVEIARILGITNKYLSAGGVADDSHFPWHPLSTLSRIRSDLDKWAASTMHAFAVGESLFGRPDGVTLALSKLIYHLVHCLLYRPFLPIDLAELSGTSQNPSWQVEAIQLCFMHANAIVELVDMGKSAGIRWPAFVGYCVSTAGTVHVHGAHYMSLQDGDIISNSAHYLASVMEQLADLSTVWAGVSHQKETLQTVYASHSRLVQSLAASPMRFAPIFQMEDFFDRYPGANIDGAHVTFRDTSFEFPPEQRSPGPAVHSQRIQSVQNHAVPSQMGIEFESIAHGTRPFTQTDRYKRRAESSPYPYPTPAIDVRRDTFEQQIHTQQSEEQYPHNINDIILAESIFTSSFAFSPVGQVVGSSSNQDQAQDDLSPHEGFEDRQTTEGTSAGRQSAEPEGDPFLRFLEHIAQDDAGSGQSGLNEFMHGLEASFADEER